MYLWAVYQVFYPFENLKPHFTHWDLKLLVLLVNQQTGDLLLPQKAKEDTVVGESDHAAIPTLRLFDLKFHGAEAKDIVTVNKIRTNNIQDSP